MRLHRNLTWLVPLLVIAAFPLWSIPVGDFLKPRGDWGDDGEQAPGQSSHNFTMEKVKVLQNQHGQTTAVVRAERAKTGDNADLLVMDLVDADLYDGEGKLTRVTAASGTYNMADRKLTLVDDVVIRRTAEAQVLYTDLLIYRASTRTVVSPGNTRLESRDAQIDGGSLSYDIAAKRYIISNGVICVLGGFAEP